MRLALLALAVVLSAAPVRAAEFVVKAGAPNQVVFLSKAPTETFEGKTNRVDGRIVVDPAAPIDTVVVSFEVDLASLDTGVGKRDGDMREKYLETKKYPKAVFVGASVSPKGTTLAAGKATTFECEGDFTLHGVTKRIKVSVDVTPRDANTLAIKATFSVPLADYKIERPKFLFLKLGEVQQVTVDAVATATP